MEIDLHVPCASARAERLHLRAPRGHDELFESPVGGALALVDALLVDDRGRPGTAGRAAALPLWQYDRVLAAIHRELYGDQLTCVLGCVHCHTRSTLDLSLSELCAVNDALDDDDRALLARLRGPDDAGIYALDERHFRLPTPADLLDVRSRADAERELEMRCLLGGSADDTIDRAMELAGPRLDVDIDTACPSCARPHSLRFAIEDFLCAALARERPLVIREIHLLARAYHWSRAEILAMSRRDRRMHVRLVLDDGRARG